MSWVGERVVVMKNSWRGWVTGQRGELLADSIRSFGLEKSAGGPITSWVVETWRERVLGDEKSERGHWQHGREAFSILSFW